VREIRMLRTTRRKLETELRVGLRHRTTAKASGQRLLPVPVGHRASFRPYVCPAKADTFSGSQSRQGNSQSLVARWQGGGKPSL